MSVLTSVGILVLSALVLAFFQLVPGVFAYFNHFVHGKFSHKRASDLATFFILGVETSVTLIFLCLYIVICSSPAITFVIDSEILAWILAGILLAIAFIIFGCYYRSGPGTKLFISRRLADNFNARITNAKSRSDAFILGLISIIPELIFTLPIYLIILITIVRLDLVCPARAGLIFLFALLAILSLFIIRTLVATNHNLADYLKFRFKNKTFIRCCIPLFYFIIASLIIIGATL